MRSGSPERVVALALVLGLARTASAEPRALSGRYSAYEETAIADAAASLHTSRDPSPEGKTIERIDFVRLDPIDNHDPLPIAMDAVHATSREHVLRHELLVKEGDKFSTVTVDESARNLRLLPQLSLVLAVAMKGSTEDKIRLVVITKDVWSLYVDFDLAVTGGGLELLDLEPKETNVAGLQQIALTRFVLQPKSYSLGASYEIPRLDGRFLDLYVDGNVIFERDRGTPEGSYGTASIKQPLYSSRAEWAWSTGIAWKDQVTRRYVDAKVTVFTPSAPDAVPVPWVYRERTVSEQAKLTRSFGWENKHDFSVGVGLSRSMYRVPNDASDPASIAEFYRAAVPVGEARVGPFVQWHAYSSDFLRTLDLDSLSLQEDNRLGHDVWLRAYAPVHALGSTRDLLGVYGAAAYGVPFRDGLVRASLESTVEKDIDRISDASVKGQLGFATPRLGFGRFIVAVTALDRVRNYLNVESFLGGESLLRGYPTRFLAGRDLVAANVEYRTPALSLTSVQLGGAAFYDVGDAPGGLDQIELRHSAGVGARAVFPQVARVALRLDVGFPLSLRPLPQNVPPVEIFFAFRQAIGLPIIGDGLAP